MQRILVIAGILLIILIGVQSFISYNMSGIEKHKYTVIKEVDDVEIRRYETALFSSVVLNTPSYDQASNLGFRVLAGYIFGGNASGEKIAMTSPVAMELGDSLKMSFMVPSTKSENELPKPKDAQIFFEKKEGQTMAAIQFGGWANDERIKVYKKKLATILNKNGIKFKGNFSYLGYNPPYTLINRRNEIVVEVEGF